jgi:hypothetical protein
VLLVRTDDMFTPLKLGLGALLTAAAVTAVPSVAATARSITVTDARNTPASVDVTSVTYRNGETSAGGAIRVRDLRRSGSLVPRIGPPDSDVMYYVTAWIRPDNTVGKRVEYVTDVSPYPTVMLVQGDLVLEPKHHQCFRAAHLPELRAIPHPRVVPGHHARRVEQRCGHGA